jgi:hypothetical protein
MTTPLQEHEIWHFENVISLETCSSLVMAISHAFEGKRLDEIPFEHVESKELLSALRNVESSVLDMVSKEFGRRAIMPSSWNEVCYIRKKDLHHQTPLHRDRDFFDERGYFSQSGEMLAFTWWIPATSVDSMSSRLKFLGLDGQSCVTVPMKPGDAVVFSSNMYHEASLQRRKSPRFSIDGRFVFQREDSGLAMEY